MAAAAAEATPFFFYYLTDIIILNHECVLLLPAFEGVCVAAALQVSPRASCRLREDFTVGR